MIRHFDISSVFSELVSVSPPKVRVTSDTARKAFRDFKRARAFAVARNPKYVTLTTVTGGFLLIQHYADGRWFNIGRHVVR